MATNQLRKKAEQGRSTKKAGGRGEQKPTQPAATSQTAGGVPQGANNPSQSEEDVQERLAQQREAGEQRAAAAAQRRPEGSLDASGVFTAVVKNGLGHRRCGVLFGAEPVTVDVSGWSNEEKERFFNDSLLMIVPGVHVNAGGALLAPARGIPAQFTGGNGENATPEMLKAMANGQAMAHPASGAAVPVVGSRPPAAVTSELEKLINNEDEDGE